MSLAALLNEDDANPSQRQSFVKDLNQEFRALGARDIKEQRYQDWKMLSYQEFELVTEWNNQSRELGSNGCEKLISNMDSTRREWEQFQEYAARKEEVIRQQRELRLKQQQEQEQERLQQEKERQETLEQERHQKKAQAAQAAQAAQSQNQHGDRSRVAIKSEPKDNKTLNGNSNPQSRSTDFDGHGDGAEDENEDDEEIDEDEDEEAEIEEEPEHDEEVLFPDDDDNDKDFYLEDEKGEFPSKSKKVDLSSERAKIRREIARMVNKNKNVKAKKRRFTNSTIIEYVSDEKLEVKLTLKQYHVRQLKRLLAENKRAQEEDANESTAKKRKVGGKGDEAQIPSSIEGLPTYGLKMTIKEARGIQRHYDTTYFTIWKDMARKDSAKVARLVQQTQSSRNVNFKKTSSLVAREARKWQLRNFRQLKDFQTKARRGVREMSSFWKKNEREERDLKKKAEKEALDQAKKEEEERENKRQARKLNFLITQTELYSHFIGRKIKTDEIEGSMADSNLKQANGGGHNIDLSKTQAAKTDFHSIDFDNEDDENLRLKAAQNASSALLATQAKAREFDSNPDEEDELNFQNPTSLGEITIDQPRLLTCTLKEYQLKGLNWLANLYDQGINGILADEMGLGKTVQSISVLAHLAENHNIWGPFIVVTPASTLHNWVNEISKFLPDFKILPYWGNGNDRKILRRFWDRKQFRYGKDAPFHVMVTSYQMVVSDAAYLQKMKWQYMILDEAQAIKSSQSSRWKNLLSFHCRNRLLLTGTPIQNSMQELWALLHFIMPSLFDSHDEFSDWFSKDIESHAQSNTKLNQQQLRRLHMILKPFMLRRIKKNVQSELGEKIEIDVMCDLTRRQNKLYQVLRSQMSAAYDAIENAAGNDEASSDQNIVNTVMQFRKVCNHPDLFEREDVRSPLAFTNFGKSGSLLREGDLIDVDYSARNSITYQIPRLVFDELIAPNFQNDSDVRNKILNHTFNIFHPSNSRSLCMTLSCLTGYSQGEIKDLSHQPIVQRALKLNEDKLSEGSKLLSVYDDKTQLRELNKNSFIVEDERRNLVTLSKSSTKGVLDSLLNIKQGVYEDEYMNSWQPAYHPAVSAPPINLEVSNSNYFSHEKHLELFDPFLCQALNRIPAQTQYELRTKFQLPVSQFPISECYPEALNKNFSSAISMPSMDRFITESTKLKKLDELLVDLKKGDHRVLIYFQMTKMMDLMEEYLTYRQYKHIRLDGSSKLEDRRDLVHDWQTKPDIFIFLLSTRAGGLGINLTAADTVIFYDSDWNPTIDSQAMDRAHRLGQTRQVTVYRLLIRGTIEERMRDRAKQKEHVQQVVMEGKTQDKDIQTVDASG
ncbi:chromatin-remodeling ATPase INO80 [Lachancea thermotolerans CBS 6340]|uniref:Chromatin-remodeling ATPase INO80 n=1 Tax=Lachancea thermotolerans (strain ATCC 56472 / CBS 6340 / NRRL Y-8284) TaxID=559295 RepID=C5DMR9_LACTC|nr:KLTH0G11132p [Lachancea thermotolerans CBS 6340]CAR25080.1 KLTH0G11132p [Lachancea thermotolerans CBS 6340]